MQKIYPIFATDHLRYKTDLINMLKQTEYTLPAFPDYQPERLSGHSTRAIKSYLTDKMKDVDIVVILIGDHLCVRRTITYQLELIQELRLPTIAIPIPNTYHEICCRFDYTSGWSLDELQNCINLARGKNKSAPRP